jgi:hypothetical protein
VQSFAPSKARSVWLAAGLAVLVSMTWSRAAAAAGKKGDFLQTDTLGVGLVTRDLTANTTRTVADVVNLSEYVGLHYYAIQRVRFGMNVQLTERLWPDPAPASRVQRFALLPQVGWNFYDPFFAGLVFVFAPRSEGRANWSMGANVIGGASIPVSKVISISAALEVPWTYYPRQVIGLTALTGVAFRF